MYLINVGINGEESREAFRREVEQVLGTIEGINPDAAVLWTSLHALPVEISYIVTDRVDPRNVVLNALASEGRLTLLPWAEVATANPQIYLEDGVHYFGNEQLFVTTLVSGLDAWIASQP